MRFVESSRDASAARIPEKRVFKPRSIPDIRVQKAPIDRIRETPEPEGYPVAEPQAGVSLSQTGSAPESSAFRRNGARPLRTPAPVWRKKSASGARDNSRQSLNARIAESLKRFHGWTALLALLATATFGSLLGAVFSLGDHNGRIAAIREMDEARAKGPAARSGREREEVRLRLDKALSLERSGDAEGGWKSIQGISREHSHLPSLAYAEALVALRAGKYAEALDLTKISISREERVSDSLALQSALDASPPLSSGVVQEDLLRKAADADPMNPNPLIQLAGILSAHGQDEQAESLVRSAKLRLLPVDSHLVVDASLEMLKIKRAPTADLSSTSETSGLAEKDFPTAYSAMRRGDFQAAASILETARRSVPPDVFDYLLKASPIRDYALEPKITRFY